eukprot:TRINITY_DN67965_c0_g1_i2.p1 TRINITY_DN67965_c0_g1~~TRINITY_DN67965_c0_g1_i2.p1  ORF type:complete len:297 (+),score=56.46 TRINITY_DN67965_c0_g1_i2:77-892(+)
MAPCRRYCAAWVAAGLLAVTDLKRPLLEEKTSARDWAAFTGCPSCSGGPGLRCPPRQGAWLLERSRAPGSIASRTALRCRPRREKQRRGKLKRDRRVTERGWRLDNAVSDVQRRTTARVTPLWLAVREELRERGLLEGEGLADDGDWKALGEFLIHAENASVDGSVLAAGGRQMACAYMCDKFEDRVDQMAAAAVQAWQLADLAEDAQLQARLRTMHSDSLRVASLGGGPGNDAAGFGLFASEVLSTQRIALDTFDLSAVWQPFCEAAMAA